jgi:two-component system NtrC family sensor kinase
MNVSARLVLLLTITISAVMSAATWFTLRQRAATLESAARDEVRAHALTLQIALEEDYSTNRTLDAQRLVDRMRENSGLYGVFLFDINGVMTISSNELAPEEMRDISQAKRAITTGHRVEAARELDGVEVYSVIVPVQKNGVRIGALEVAAPIAFVRAHINDARSDIILTASLLGLAVLLVTLLVTHYSLTRPVRSLLDGALALGRGALDYRVPIPRGGGEFAVLAREFNRMADSLDVQARKAAREAEERLALERRLRHSENLAMVGRLAAGVAHEMGAPLQVIDGRAKQLLNNPEVTLEARQRNLTIIRSQSDRITRIVRQLLNLSRPYNLSLQTAELSKLISGTIELIEINAERSGVQIEVTAPEEIEVQADPDLLHQVFLNICQNAVQAMSVQHLENGRQAIDKRLEVRLEPQGATKDGRDFAAVRFADTGGGIAPEHLAQIFDPFFTTKDIGQGTGLGLAVSNRIIEEHGGWIEVINNEAGGATFSVFLPRANSEQPIAL